MKWNGSTSTDLPRSGPGGLGMQFQHTRANSPPAATSAENLPAVRTAEKILVFQAAVLRSSSQHFLLQRSAFASCRLLPSLTYTTAHRGALEHHANHNKTPGGLPFTTHHIPPHLYVSHQRPSGEGCDFRRNSQPPSSSAGEVDPEAQEMNVTGEDQAVPASDCC
ncbi:unnamed protein product [Zymoseptoria tritici ST99CH_1A5]|uniref:Uncharacterized protein n=1 Tax=Zymoseptoria tritici ST99CH_1A5 TaxID=1276529 RepID=A0A1Y6M0N4_ZYMTR|nr:unnamed protein product [Zymoseptoria tritici ST99CH_1A5]